MRLRKPLVLIVPSLMLVLAAACEGGGDGGTSSGSFNSEAGAFEASVLDTFVPPVDAGADTNTPPPPGPITVTVTTGAAPAANVRVLFHDATGAILGDTKTDTTGKASSSNTTVAMVSVLYYDLTNEPEFVTYLGVTPGDNLTVAAQSNDDSSTTGSWSTTFASNAITANSTSYYTSAGEDCGSQAGSSLTAPQIIPFYPTTCPGPPNSMLAYSVNASQTVTGYAFAKGITRPAAGATVAIGPLTMAAPGTRTLAAMNVPANSEPQGDVVAIAGLEAFTFYSNSGTVADPGGGKTFPIPVGFADAYQSHVYTSAGNGLGGQSEVHLVRREVATAATDAALVDLDFATALPALQSVSIDVSTPARPGFTLNSAAAQTAVSGFVELYWETPTATSCTWSFYVPGSLGSFQAPALPADLAALVPTTSARLAQSIVGTSSLVPDYATSKTVPVDPTGVYAALSPSTPLPAAATLKVNVVRPED